MKYLNAVAIMVAIHLFSPSQAQAQDAFGVCESSEVQCQALMVELKKVQLADDLRLARPLVNPSFLCSQDNPDCCPAPLMPVCLAHGGEIVEQTILALEISPDTGGCPFSGPICDSLGGFWCGPDRDWNPWNGCSEIAELPPVPPLPPICENNERWNGKICVPVPCLDRRFGIEIPCGPIFDGDVASRDLDALRKMTTMLQTPEVTSAARISLREQATSAMDGVSQ